MYIPASVLAILLLLYFWKQDEIRDEIASLRNEVTRDDRNNSHYDYDYGLSDPNPRTKEEEKIEYSLQESQDRSKIGVSYDATLKEIRNAYVKLRKSGPTANPEIDNAYHRLTEIENKRDELVKRQKKTQPQITNEKKESDDSETIVITCGKCNKQQRVLRDLGAIIVKCSSCEREARVRS